jgi:hypothetical protein
VRFEADDDGGYLMDGKTITDRGLSSLSWATGLPLSALKWARDNNAEADLAAAMMKGLTDNPRGLSNRMVITTGEVVRAIASSMYNPVKHSDLLGMFFKVVTDLGYKFESGSILKGGTLRATLVGEKFGEVDGSAEVGDEVKKGFTLKNNFYASSSLGFEGLIYRLVCTNGMTTRDKGLEFNRAHRGSAHDLGMVDAWADDNNDLLDAFNEAITHAVTDEAWASEKSRLDNLAATDALDGLEEELADYAAKRFKLDNDEAQKYLINVRDDGDATHWGAVNALTKLANTAVDFDRSVDLTHKGSEFAELKWGTVTDAVKKAATKKEKAAAAA